MRFYLIVGAILGFAAIVIATLPLPIKNDAPRETVLLAIEIGYLCHQKGLSLEECKAWLRTSK
jgi:hypothetical protein